MKLPILNKKTAKNSYAHHDMGTPEPKKKKSKRLIFEIIGGFLLLIFMASSAGNISKSEYDKVQNEYNELQSEYDKLQKDYDTLTASINNYESELGELQNLRTEYSEYKERMEPYEDLIEIEACGRMNPNKARQVSLQDAVNSGYEQCRNCY